MKLTVERTALTKLIRHLRGCGGTKGSGDRTMRLWACAGHVFVESNGMLAGTEALVLEPGTCHVVRAVFLKLAQSYKNKPNITFSADEQSLRVENTKLSHLGYSPEAVAPEGFAEPPNPTATFRQAT